MLAEDYPIWHHRLTHEAWGWTGERAVAEDLASAALEKCLRAERRGQELSLTYAYRALRTCWLDQVRRERLLRMTELTDSHAYTVDPLAELRMQAMLAFLSPAHQQMVLLIMEGFSYQEIAEKLGLTVDALKARLHRMRRQARKWGLAA